MKPSIKRTFLTLYIGAALLSAVIFYWSNSSQSGPGTAMASTSGLKAGMIDPQNGKKIKYWVAPMDPTYIRNEPGKSPMGMDLVPEYEDSAATKEPASTIRVDSNTIQNMGVRLAPVVRRPLTKNIRAFGNVTYDESRLYTVNTKFDGWIEKLYVDYVGQQVAKGQPLFDIYSPDLVTAQQEYLLALRQYRRITDNSLPQVQENARRLMEAARTRLNYWDISDAQIQQIQADGQPRKTITVFAPASGVVLKKNVYAGHFVKAGQNQFEIADLTKVWVDVEIYEYELPWVRTGMPAMMDLSYIPGKKFNGRVLYVYPYLSEKTRTARLRLEFNNTNLTLKPDMYANVYLESIMENESLVIPQEAVIDSGVRKLAFVSKGNGRFEPRELQLGLEVNGSGYQVLAGLNEGEQVVTSAQFMLDSESRLREAIQKMLAVRASASPNNSGDDLDMSGMSMTDAGNDDLDMSELDMGSDAVDKKPGKKTL